MRSNALRELDAAHLIHQLVNFHMPRWALHYWLFTCLR